MAQFETKSTTTQSPFVDFERQTNQISLLTLLLIMVVAAGTASLVAYATQVPAITSELNAWMGRPSVTVENAVGRRAQVVFALACYTAPLVLGLMVSLIHTAIDWINVRLNQRSIEDEQFRM